MGMHSFPDSSLDSSPYKRRKNNWSRPSPLKKKFKRTQGRYVALLTPTLRLVAAHLTSVHLDRHASQNFTTCARASRKGGDTEKEKGKIHCTAVQARALLSTPREGVFNFVCRCFLFLEKIK